MSDPTRLRPLGDPSPRDHAQQMALRGFRVLPLGARSKAAIGKDWPTNATTDPTVIETFAGNYGYTLDGLLVIDIDPRDAFDGEAEWAKLCTELGIESEPATFTVRTPSGGRHLVFTAPTDVRLTTRSGSSAPRPGVEVRTDGRHYCVGPGSTLENGSYELIDDSPPAPLPAALKMWLAEAGSTPKATTESGRFIPDSGPIPYHLRHDTLLRYLGRLARRVVARALSPEDARRLLWVRYGECEQPPGDVELWQPYADALAHYIATDAADMPASDATDGLRLVLLREMKVTPITWRIEDMLPEGGRMLLVAQRKKGKTHAALNLARSVLTGAPFLGAHAVLPVPRVAYLNAELSETMFASWARDVGIPEDGLVVANLRGRPNPLRDAVEAASFAARLAEFGVTLIVVDTFGKMFSGTSQNDAADVAVWTARVDALAANAGISEVVVVAHAGWSEDGGRARGSSGLEDWPDSVVRITSAKGDGTRRFIFAEGRDVDVPEAELIYDAGTRRLTVASGNRAELKAQERIAAKVETVLGLFDHDPTARTTTALATAMRGNTQDNFAAVNLAATLGRIVAVGDSDPPKFGLPTLELNHAQNDQLPTSLTTKDRKLESRSLESRVPPGSETRNCAICETSDDPLLYIESLAEWRCEQHTPTSLLTNREESSP